MTKDKVARDEYFRELARLMKQIKAVCDNYHEGNCDNIVITIDKYEDGSLYAMDNGFSDYDDSYDFTFTDGCDIENGKIVYGGRSGAHVMIAKEAF